MQHLQCVTELYMKQLLINNLFYYYFLTQILGSACWGILLGFFFKIFTQALGSFPAGLYEGKLPEVT